MKLRIILSFVLLLSLSLLLNDPLASGIEKDDPTLKRVVLDNGLVVILKQKHDIPMVAMQVWVKAGSITEGKNMGSGLSHYFEHMLGKRTKKRKNEGFYNDIRKMGGSDANAYTTYDRTVYHFTIQSEYFDNAIEAFSDMIQNTILDDKESEKEIQVILKEINMGDDSPDRYLWKLFSQTAFTTHPYRYPIIGYRELFTSLTKKDMLDYYSTMYSPNNMTLVVVGDFEMDHAIKTITQNFKDFKRKKLPPIYIPIEPRQIAMRKIVKEFGIKTTKVAMGYVTVNGLSKDVAPLDVLASVLGQGRTSRLYKRLKHKKQLVNSVSAGSWTPTHKGIFEISIDLDQKNLNAVNTIIEKEINKIKKEGITKKELKRAIRSTQVSSIQQMQTIGGYARSLAYGEFIGNLHYEKQYIKAVSQVKNEDVIRVANQYLKKNYLNIAILVPKNSSKKVTPDRKKPGKKGKVEKIVLKNGIILLLKEDHSIPLVGLHVKFNGGYRYENKNNQGIYNLFSRLLFKGTKSKKAQKIAETIENTGGYLYAASGANYVSINGNFLKENFDTGFELFLDILSNAKFPKNEMNKAKKEIYAEIKKRDDDIWSASRYHLRRIRYEDHPYSFDGIGTEKNIKSLKSKDLLRLYKRVITPKNAVIAIFGDINKKQILRQLKKKSAFNKRKAKAPKVKKVLPLKKVIKDTFYKKEKQKQSIIKILFDGPNYYSKDKYPLYLLTHVFSGIGSRLFMDLRSKRTLAYSTGGVYQARDDLGLFLFYIGTEPAKRDQAIKGLFENIKKVKEELITERELEIAKNSAIGRIIKQLQTLNGQASIHVKYEKLKLGHDYYLKLIKELKKVTREDIKRVANKYLDLNRYALSVVESKTPKP